MVFKTYVLVSCGPGANDLTSLCCNFYLSESRDGDGDDDDIACSVGLL